MTSQRASEGKISSTVLNSMQEGGKKGSTYIPTCEPRQRTKQMTKSCNNDLI
jgi:hypothetical protein